MKIQEWGLQGGEVLWLVKIANIFKTKGTPELRKAYTIFII